MTNLDIRGFSPSSSSENDPNIQGCHDSTFFIAIIVVAPQSDHIIWYVLNPYFTIHTGLINDRDKISCNLYNLFINDKLIDNTKLLSFEFLLLSKQ